MGFSKITCRDCSPNSPKEDLDRMTTKSKIREKMYLEELKKASKMAPAEKLKLALELSDFCRYLKNKTSVNRGKK